MKVFLVLIQYLMLVIYYLAGGPIRIISLGVEK